MGEPADDERWLVVDGRRWRRTDPSLAAETVARLKSHLGRARNAVRRSKGDADATADARHRVQLAKTGLGERGAKWWESTTEERRERADSALTELDELAPPAD